MDPGERPIATGRASSLELQNRFERTRLVRELEQVEHDDEYLDSLRKVPTQYLPDRSRSVVSSNDSPDVPFSYSVNPYRGCAHGCAYCYARPSHEYLGWNAGLDFETRILVKDDAPALLREFLAHDRWTPEPIAMSGVTDPYQPVERERRITRGCLEVALEHRQPVMLITKNALVVRDLDLLSAMAALSLVHVTLSVTTLDQSLSRRMEPRTSAPAARLRAVSALASAGVPARVAIAPVIPGLNDHEIPAILAAAREAGAAGAGFQLVRLPGAVVPVFREWLAREFPDRASKVESRILSARHGRWNSGEIGTRMKGQDEASRRLADLFRVVARKHGLDQPLPALDTSAFRRPGLAARQMWLF